ncbi:hypothethical protein (plasmid) [Ralstonia solanacearum PSI07]|nr:hypothethical protein [Ralstonia solanacearum PSI07]
MMHASRPSNSGSICVDRWSSMIDLPISPATLRASASATLALNSGYHMAFLSGAIFAAAAGVLGGLLLRRGQSDGAGAQPAADSDDVTTAHPVPATGNAAATAHH